MKQHYARLKKAGTRFEVAIDSEKAIEFKQGTVLDIKEVLKDIHVYLDAAKGLRPSEDELRNAFGTTDQTEIAKTIILKGEVQLTGEQRTEMHQAKRRQVLDLLHLWGIDPRTKAPHPVARLENAFEEAKVRIDDNKSAQEQISDIIKKLAPILPIKIESKQIKLTIPAQYAHKAYGQLKRMATIKQDKWTPDGSWDGIVEIPGGLEPDLYETLNKICHGELVAKHVE